MNTDLKQKLTILKSEITDCNQAFARIEKYLQFAEKNPNISLQEYILNLENYSIDNNTNTLEINEQFDKIIQHYKKYHLNKPNPRIKGLFDKIQEKFELLDQQ